MKADSTRGVRHTRVDLTKNVETRVKLNSITFRPYQIPIIRAIENDGFRRAVVLLPRRAGKDFLCLQIALRQCLRKTCTIFYIFPTYSNARKAIWDAITIDGKRMLDFFPDQICKKNSSEMKITFINGSVLQFMGSTEYDRLRGTNPYMVIFSEYAYQNPMAFQTIRPILAANEGIAIMISTTFGKNHFYDLYQLALNSDDWFCYKKTVEETMHISDEALAQERAQMSEDMFFQEYYCSFDRGVSGAVFAKIMNELLNNNRLSNVPWERSFPVHTAWDIGYADSTAIIFFQVIGTVVHIIDYYENNQHGLEHYIKYLDTKPYKYGKHVAPHDMANHSFSTGVSRIEMAANLGVNFIVAPKLPIQDGIEASKVTLAKCYIDNDKCEQLIKNFNLYRYEWDDRRQMYKNTFFHGPESHSVDAFRMLSVTLPKVAYKNSPEELDARYNKAVHGSNNNNTNVFPEFFR